MYKRQNVDFPIPGSPPSRTTEPLTNPPPRTLSSSCIVVAVRCDVSSGAERISGTREFARVVKCVVAKLVLEVRCISSVIVFQELQESHRPIHRGYCVPHS